MRSNNNHFGAFIIVVFFIVAVLILAGECSAAKQIYYQQDFYIGGKLFTADSMGVYVYGGQILVGDTVVAVDATSKFGSITVNVDATTIVHYKLQIYADSVNCAPCYEGPYWVKPSTDSYDFESPSAPDLSIVYLHVDDIAGDVVAKKCELVVTLETERFVKDTCIDRYLARYKEWSDKPDVDGLIQIELKKNQCYDDPNLMYKAVLEVGGQSGGDRNVGYFIVRDSSTQMLKVEYY